MTIDAVIFDMDGLMLDTERISLEFERQAHREQGIPFRDLTPLVMGKNSATVRQIQLEQYGPDYPIDALRARCRELWDQYLLQSPVPVKPGLFPLLNWLRERGIPCGVASSTSAASALPMLEKGGIAPYMDAMVFGDMVQRSKPAPDIFLEAARRLKADPGGCIVLEDSPNGILAAHRAGMRPVMVPDLVEPGPELSEILFGCVRQLDQVITLLQETEEKNMEYRGNPVSEGIAVGKAYLYQPYAPEVAEGEIPEAEAPQAIARYEKMLEGAKRELEAIRQRLEASGDGDKAKIFAAHQDILFDVAMDEEIRDKISYDCMTPEWAVHKVYEKFIKLLGKAKDDLIRERVADMRDVKNRLLRVAAGVAEKNLAALDGPAVVVAHDLLPSDTATLDRKNVLAIVTEVGGATSHSAIIARSYEIPALLGVEGIMDKVSHGQELAVDAVEGLLIPDPDPAVKEDFAKKREAFLQRRAEEKKFLAVEPRMADGTLVPVHLNVGSASDQELAGEKYTDGVGLFRTEFIYMGKEQLPTEEEQYEIYKKILTAFGDRPVTLRTLDIGGDKKLQCMELPVEENPFLGNRALRLCFTMPEVFLTQLRAALRASVHGNLWIMFPMVGSMDDIRRAKGFVEQAKAQLDAEGIPYSPSVKIGIMIEIPSIALVADMAAKEVDFASIGTNDLTQYATAVDRMNPALREYYQGCHPALFRLIGYVVSSFAKEGKPVSVCGEMGGDPLSAAVLVGLGMSKLSMGLASVARIKKMLSGLTIEKARELAGKAQSLATHGEVEEYLKAELAPLL